MTQKLEPVGLVGLYEVDEVDTFDSQKLIFRLEKIEDEIDGVCETYLKRGLLSYVGFYVLFRYADRIRPQYPPPNLLSADFDGDDSVIWYLRGSFNFIDRKNPTRDIRAEKLDLFKKHYRTAFENILKIVGEEERIKIEVAVIAWRDMITIEI